MHSTYLSFGLAGARPSKAPSCLEGGALRRRNGVDRARGTAVPPKHASLWLSPLKQEGSGLFLVPPCTRGELRGGPCVPPTFHSASWNTALQITTGVEGGTLRRRNGVDRARGTARFPRSTHPYGCPPLKQEGKRVPFLSPLHKGGIKGGPCVPPTFHSASVEHGPPNNDRRGGRLCDAAMVWIGRVGPLPPEARILMAVPPQTRGKQIISCPPCTRGDFKGGHMYSTFSEHLGLCVRPRKVLGFQMGFIFQHAGREPLRVRTGPRIEVVSTKTKTVLRIWPSMRRWPARSNVWNATRVAARVAATCGIVSDHIISLSEELYLKARPTISAAIPLPTMRARMIAAVSAKLSMRLRKKTIGLIRKPVPT